MSLSEWDRDYIEHLIARDQQAEEELQASHAEYVKIWFMGEDRYYWDLHSWPKPRQVKTHHEVMVTRCPECHTRLDLSLVPAWHPPTNGNHVHHSAGCEFFRAEQGQWVDDYADIRRIAPTNPGSTRPIPSLIRGLTMTEAALLQIMGANPSRYQMKVELDDGRLVRTPLEVPFPV